MTLLESVGAESPGGSVPAARASDAGAGASDGGAGDGADRQPHWHPEPWFADVVERLLHDFEGRYPLPEIVDTVRQCRDELQGSPPPAMPELVDRLARARLSE